MFPDSNDRPVGLPQLEIRVPVPALIGLYLFLPEGNIGFRLRSM